MVQTEFTELKSFFKNMNIIYQQLLRAMEQSSDRDGILL